MVPALRRLLWIDCVAALSAGALVLALTPWLTQLHRLPRMLLLIVGVVNLLYGACSLSLALRTTPPRRGVAVLAVANAGWAMVLLAVVTTVFGTASVFGIGHLLGEALFVALLGRFEWQRRIATAG